MILRHILLFFGILWFGSMAGFFWSFSVVIMPGLGFSEPTTALSAMQDINLAVRIALFAVGFFGAVLIAAAIAVWTLMTHPPARALNGAAAVLYLVGVLGVTALGNVPMNEALALLDASSATDEAALEEYLRDWTALTSARLRRSSPQCC